MVNNNLINILNPSVVRKPILKFNNIIPIIDEVNYIDYQTVKYLFSQDVINKAIYFASDSLYRGLTYDIGDKNKLTTSFLKYYIRMCSRTTPFGLFATTGLLGVNNNKAIKISADAGWVDNVIIKILSKPENLRKLSFQCNQSMATFSNRYEIFHYKKKINNYFVEGSNSIEKNILLDIIFKSCKEFCSYSTLYEIVKKNCSFDIQESIFLEYINNLVRQSYLITNINLTVNEDILDNLISNLVKNDISFENIDQLLLIKEQINLLSETIEEIKIDKLEEIKTLMKDITLANNYFYCIGIENIELTNTTLNYKEISEFINFSLKLSTTCYAKNYKSVYANKFLEKYSENRDVNLVELLDNNLGIGFPDYSLKNQSNSNIEIFDKIILNMIYNNKDEIDLSEIEKLKLLNDSEKRAIDTNLFNKSFELFFNKIVLKDEIISDNIYLAPSMCSLQIGNTIGRFIHAFNDEDYNIIKNNNMFINELYKKENIEIVTLLIDLNNSQLLDLLPKKIQTDYVCAINVNVNYNNDHILDLNDIVVTVNYDNQIIFKSKKLNKRIIFVSYSNLNHEKCPPIYRFLIDFSLRIGCFNGLINIYKHTNILNKRPRIRYKNIIISPKMLIIEKDKLNNWDKIREKIQNYFNTKYVYLIEHDNRLLLNVETNFSKNVIISNINKNGRIQIGELEKEVLYGLIQRKEMDLMEIVTPYYLNNNKVKDKYVVNQKNCNLKDRAFVPFSEWTQYNIYISSNYQEDFLIKSILPLVKRLFKEKCIDKFFFIRYKDLNEHLRIRFKITEENTFLKIIKSSINNYFYNEYISNVSLETYEREVERYGGIECIECAESFFMMNSFQVLNFLNISKKYDTDAIMPVVFIHIMNKFKLKDEEKISLLDNVNYHGNMEAYRKLKNVLIMNYKIYIRDRYSELDKNQLELYNLITMCDNSIEKFNEKIEKYSIFEKNRIILSCLHMYCNRLYGIDRNKEIRIMSITHHLLESIKYVQF